jgi:hypothetical protein
LAGRSFGIAIHRNERHAFAAVEFEREESSGILATDLKFASHGRSPQIHSIASSATAE